ncbi:MAG TPA: hypothetical protein PKJ56_04615, partial [Promineifilum sp.]|nr:hypothetical protein [Promineifilum sp.]
MEEEKDTGTSKRLSWPIIAGFIAVIILIFLGLLLPPISLGTRLAGGNRAPETAKATLPAGGDSSAVVLPDGVTLTTTGGSPVEVTRMTLVDLLSAPDEALAAAAAALPAGAAVGDAYILTYTGDAPTGRIALPLPGGLTEVRDIDIRGWSGDGWTYV